MRTCTKDIYGDLGAEIEGLREQLDRMLASLEQAAKGGSIDALNAASKAAHDVGSHVSETIDSLAGKMRQAGASASEGRAQLEGAVRHNPLAALSLAVLAGFLAGRLLRR
jgi:ElaB/YqjD/DUF883 family membrane-anchored ribosome-binding protein